MSLKDKAISIFKPSRYKSGKAYGFRGGDWDFSRGSASSTRYDESGLVSDVATDVPRLDYNVVGDCPRIRLEGATTNHCARSEDFLSWTRTNVGIDANAGTAPDGTNTASRFYNNAGTSVQFLLYRQTGITVVSGRNYILSVFVKPEKYFKVCLHLGGSSQFTYDLRDGASANVIEYPNGWYRVWASITASGSSDPYMYITFDDVGLRTESTARAKTLLIWGAQIQEYALSDYIPTVGSSVSTVDDYVNTTSITGLTGTDEYTIFVDMNEFNQAAVTTMAMIIGVNAGIYSGSIHQYTRNFYYTNASGSSYALGSMDETTNYNRLAFKHLGNGLFHVYRNGVRVWVYDHSSVFSSNQTYNRAYFNGVRYVYSGTFGRVEGGLLEHVVYKGTISDSECRALTSYVDYDELVARRSLTYGHREKVEANIERIKNL
jgi:hypothetical protein